MTEQPSLSQVETFRRLLTERLGLLFEERRLPELEALLARRSQQLRRERHDYLQTLAHDTGREFTILAQELTVGETYFFRHAEQMTAFSKELLGLRDLVAGERPLRVLSAGCSTGEEPYSLAILARESGLDQQQVGFLAIDINPGSLIKARQGRYSSWSLREAPEQLKERWFSRHGSSYEIAPAIRRSVAFEQANLLGPTTDAWQTHSYDVIFCRNVLMYFRPLGAKEVVARFARLLVDGGYLFLGHAESLRDLSEEFSLLNAHDCFYYRKGALEATRPPTVRLADTPLSLDWTENIQAASDRIRKLGQAAPPWPVPEQPDLDAIAELHDEERYQEALSLLCQLPSETLELAQTRLWEALLRLHLNDVATTETICRRLLVEPSLAARAHYLLGLCRQEQGDGRGAVYEHRAATHLDPGFAMPRLHLGLLARRSNDLPSARKELDKAVLLLQTEEPQRLRMYGGGFSREALLALCRSELAALAPSLPPRHSR